MPSKNRVIFFDILRIVAICMVLVCHIAYAYGYAGFYSGTDWNKWISHVFFLDIGNIGVLIFLFVSGAVLELNKTSITTTASYCRFEIHRILRLYPAYWMSLLFSAMILLASNNHNLGNLFWQFSGFNAFILDWGGVLNTVGWCIGLFVVMYLLFPFISLAMNRTPYITLACLFIVSIISTLYINTTALSDNIPFWMYSLNKEFLITYARWFPLCNVFYFGLGVFIVKQSWYPKNTDKTGIISYLGELSFFVFLFNFPLISIARISIPVYLMFTFGLAMVAMMVDARIQEYLKLAGTRLDELIRNKKNFQS